MKIVLFIFILLLSKNILSQIDDIKSVYILNQKKVTYVIHLRSENKYEVIDFLKNQDIVIPTSMIDSGKYTINKKFGIKTITFESEKKKKFTLNKIKYFVQRGVRGFSDEDVWDFNYYLSTSCCGDD
jgi:hypothetical protein